MSKISVAAKKVGEFIKRNAFYLLILLCIASVATVIALAASGDFGGDDPGAEIINPLPDDGSEVVNPDDDEDEDDGKDDVNDDEDEEPETPTLSFASPVNGSVSLEYSDTSLVWNPTLGQYEAHLGVDFTGDDLSVFAAEAGTVAEVGSDVLDGTYVIIDHEDGYQTRYYSLDENLQVAAGDTVAKGDLIGTMSASRGSESLSGNHLHFEMSKDGTDIDPLTVLVLEEK